MKAKPVTGGRRSLNVILYSESGAGKTSLAATAPKPVFADSNKGLLSIVGRPGLEHVQAVDVNNIEDLNAIYDNCTQTGDENWARKFRTLVFDHFDDIQGIVLDKIVEAAMEKDDRRDDSVEKREWGIMGNKLRRYVRKFKSVPMHKIYICGAKDDYEEGGLKPSLQGQLSTQMPYLVDHVMYLRIGKGGQRYLHLDPKPDHWFAKTRSHWLTPAERKIKIDFDDPQQLTKIFALLAASTKPSSNSSEET